MRVIAGKYRSRPLKAPSGLNTRPTMDKVKESLFNIVGDKIIDSVVLDLFSGSGGIGIEALSRGAKFVYFNDKDIRAFNTIKENLNTLKIESNLYKLYKLNFKKCIENIDTKIDFLFMDPPYIKHVYLEAIELMNNKNLFNDDAIIICEADLSFDNFELENYLFKEYKYGNKKLLVYKSKKL